MADRPEQSGLIWWAPGEEIPWGALRVPDDAPIYAIEIVDVLSFIADLPDDFKPATQNHPKSGLPKNVWVGGKIAYVWPEILDVRSRVRFLIVDESTDLTLLENALAAWRCSNCGRRGIAPRPKTCPHAGHLCGDAKILPQIHWIVDLAGEASGPYAKKIVEAAGAVYWPEEYPHV